MFLKNNKETVNLKELFKYVQTIKININNIKIKNLKKEIKRMVKKFVSVVIVAVFMLTAFDVNVFAADGQTAIEENGNISGQEALLSGETWEGEVSGVVEVVYSDPYNVMRTIRFTVRCAIAKEWSEGNYGMITEAFFYTPSDCTIDGVAVSIEKKDGAIQNGTSYTQKFNVNSSNRFIEVEVSCDEWAEVTFTGREKRGN